MGLGDVEEVVAFVDGDFVFGAFFVDEGYVESSTEWFLLVERWGFGQWEVGGVGLTLHLVSGGRHGRGRGPWMWKTAGTALVVGQLLVYATIGSCWPTWG